ncbi:MAG: hypothetical protein ABSA63_07305 [Thermoplasmata archaeon]|jgi:hypothetical protein
MADRNRGFHSPAGYLVLGIGLGLILVGFWAAYATPAPGPCPGFFACTSAPTLYPEPLGVFLIFIGGSLMFWWALIVGLARLLGAYVPSRTPATPQSK